MKHFSVIASVAIIVSLSFGADNPAGPKPQQDENGFVELIDTALKKRLNYDDKIEFVRWAPVKLGMSPGSNTAWVCAVEYWAPTNRVGIFRKVTDSVWFDTKQRNWIHRGGLVPRAHDFQVEDPGMDIELVSELNAFQGDVVRSGLVACETNRCA